ncbi:AAA domain-containing protein [Alicyclobacillus sp. ALC3]|uniref:AAA domain-containing protein n=1 Tax=Alicyclobacillus sp. ALC3 TaxID=2796143 RepID=UPI0023796B43|nr:AAA domain-containing protein [Alicyclobacillus sp. ALC3]WDL97762.1 DUF2726 domain-containing protein [Alicyclobacillus sp. ALC3]
MDETKYLILLKGKDKTTQVRDYQVRGQTVSVTFLDSPKEYRYPVRDVEVFESRGVLDVADNQVVYHCDMPIAGIQRVVDFGERVRLLSDRGSGGVYDARAIRIERSGTNSPEADQVLQHWADIARHASVSDGGAGADTFLGQQFERLKLFVSPRSVLAAYLNGTDVRASVEEQLPADIIFPFKFNQSQREALQNALHSRISVIEGPPGTGKTQAILNILCNLILGDKTVAVVSSNNAAVENVLDKLSSEGYDFLVAALGNAANRKRFFESPPKADVDGWEVLEDERDVLRAELVELNRRIERRMTLERERAALQHEVSVYKLEQEHFETFYKGGNVDDLLTPALQRTTPEKLLSLLADIRVSVDNGKMPFLRRLMYVLRYGFCNFRRLAQNPDSLLLIQKTYYRLKIEQLERKISSLDSKLSEAALVSLPDQHQNKSKKLFRHRLYAKYSGPAPTDFRSMNYKRRFEKFVKTYPIVLSTTHSLRNCIPDNFLFDYVIIDESSQVDLVTAALALSCAQNAVIVGDTKQLPQIIDMKIRDKISCPVGIVGTPYDYFEHNILSSMLSLYGAALPRVLLREHYRCHPKIIGFCNQKYYDGKLIPFENETEGDTPLLIYRTAEGNHMSRLSHGSKGRFNQREIDVIENEVLAGTHTANLDYNDIGFTTPYRKQVERASGQLSSEIEKDTIHKYQGREKRVMILSTVLDSSVAGQRGMQFVNDPHMINVAVSRAKERLILVTDHSMFRDTQSEVGDLLRYMEYNTLDENIIESATVSVFDLLYKDYSHKLAELRRRVTKKSKYDTENIIRALMQDILHEQRYSGLSFREQVFIRNLFRDLNKLNANERQYIQNGASVDFLVYHKMDRAPVLAIEVDGFTYHENNPKQLERDHMKDRIFAAYGLPLLRLPTTGSEERNRICSRLDDILI